MMQNIPLIVQLAGFKENKLQEVFQIINCNLVGHMWKMYNVWVTVRASFKMRCSNPAIRVNWL